MDEGETERLRKTVRELKDRQDILDCITRDARGRDRQDVDLIASAFWEDGVDEHGPIVTAAPDYPARANAGHAGNFAMTSHNLTNHSCEIDGDTAWCETYVIGGLLSPDEQNCKIAFGRYLDQLERRNGEWRILVRRCTIELTAEGDASWLHSRAIKGFLRPQWSKEDPSYQRPIVANGPGERW